jgi:hypothetical protein
MQEQLERFLSWLLDARWFPETNRQEKERFKNQLMQLDRILTRMKAFSEGIPDVGLQRGVEDWQAYRTKLATFAEQRYRKAPHFEGSSPSKRLWEIPEQLLCATLILRYLYPRGSAYEKIQQFLADPTQLPYPVTVSEEAKRELEAGTFNRTMTASELNYQREGRDIPMRRYSISVKAIQSSVERLQKEIEAREYSSRLAILRMQYARYLWSQKGQAGFSDAEDAMLRNLVAAEEARKDRSSRA